MPVLDCFLRPAENMFPMEVFGPVGIFQMKSSKPVATINETMGFPLNGNSVDFGMGVTVTVDVFISVVI